MTRPWTVAQVGVRGYGEVHLAAIDRLAALGRVTLTAAVSPDGGPPGRDVPCYPTISELLEHHRPDIVSIASPIDTHAPVAHAALDGGAHLLLEKPPVPGLAEFERLRAHAERARSSIQVGFQSLGSAAIARLRELIADGTLGAISGLAIHGAWQKDRAYYARSAWAGRRTIDGHRVADGVVTNPLAHAFATALAIVGATGAAAIASITTELYHAHDIEADDTSFVRIDLVDGPPICAALTLCTPQSVDPTITLHGTLGVAVLAYTRDVLTLTIDGADTVETCPRIELLENLVDHLEGRAELLAPLARTEGFMCVLEATQDRPDPVQIPSAYISWVGDGSAARPEVADIDAWLRRALAAGATFAEIGAPWASTGATAVWHPQRNMFTG